MMRRALALVVLALASVGWASYVPGWSHYAAPSVGAYNDHMDSTRLADAYIFSGSYPQSSWFAGSALLGCQTKTEVSYLSPVGAHHTHATVEAALATWINNNAPAFFDSADCGVGASLPEPSPPSGWDMVQEFPECNGIWAHRSIFDGETLTGYEISWSTQFGGSFYGVVPVGEFESQVAAFEAACGEEVPGDPRDDYNVPPDPSDPPVNPSECIGVGGLACEATLRDIRELLARQLERDEEASVPPPFPDADIGMGTEDPPFQPPFDNSQPGWEEWRAPEVDVGELEALVLLINTRADEVMAAGAGRLPFGLIGWVPEATIEAAPVCVNPSWTILRTTEEIGWCDSAPEAWLAGTGRALSLILATFAFGFAVVRTVAWA